MRALTAFRFGLLRGEAMLGELIWGRKVLRYVSTIGPHTFMNHVSVVFTFCNTGIHDPSIDRSDRSMAENSVCRNREICEVLVGTAFAFRGRTAAACKYEPKKYSARIWLELVFFNDPEMMLCF